MSGYKNPRQDCALCVRFALCVSSYITKEMKATWSNTRIECRRDKNGNHSKKNKLLYAHKMRNVGRAKFTSNHRKTSDQRDNWFNGNNRRGENRGILYNSTWNLLGYVWQEHAAGYTWSRKIYIRERLTTHRLNYSVNPITAKIHINGTKKYISYLTLNTMLALQCRVNYVILINKCIVFCSEEPKIPASALCGQTVESFSVNSSDMYGYHCALKE
jgi:hypothetical protein